MPKKSKKVKKKQMMKKQGVMDDIKKTMSKY